MSDVVTHIKQVIEYPFFLEALTLALSVFVIVRMIRDIALALRAKRRARYLVQAARAEREFHELARRAFEEKLATHAADMERLRLSVEQQLTSMSENDRRMVYQGLHQRNRRNSDRYLRDIVGEREREVA